MADFLVEPFVVESIKHARRRKYYLVVFAGVMILAMFAMVAAIQFAIGNSRLDVARRIIVPVSLLADSLGIGLILVAMGPFRKRYLTATRRLDTEKVEELRQWENVLQELCIGAAIPLPGLVPVNLSTANSLVFKSDRRIYVGVSEWALGAGLTRDEIAGVLATQVARIATDTYIRPPFILQSRLATILVVVFVAVLIAGAIWMPLVMILPYMVLPVVALLIPNRLGYAFWPNAMFGTQSRPPQESSVTVDYLHQNMILCDSIAAKLTSDPEAIVSAVKKLNTLNHSLVFTRADFMVSNFVFTRPNSPPAADFPEPWYSFYTAGNAIITKDRLRNLEYIDEGTWRASGLDNSVRRGVSRKPALSGASMRMIVVTIVAVAVFGGLALFFVIGGLKSRSPDRPTVEKSILNKVIEAYSHQDWTALKVLLNKKAPLHDARLFYLSKLYSYFPPDTKSVEVISNEDGGYVLHNKVTGITARYWIGLDDNGKGTLDRIPEFDDGQVNTPVFLSSEDRTPYDEDRQIADRVTSVATYFPRQNPDGSKGVFPGHVYVLGGKDDRAACFFFRSPPPREDIDLICQCLSQLNSTGHLNIHQADFFFSPNTTDEAAGIAASRKIP